MNNSLIVVTVLMITITIIICSSYRNRNPFTVLPGSFSQPDVLIVSGEAAAEVGSGARETEQRKFRRCSYHRGTGSTHHAVVHERLSISAGEVQIPHSDDEEYSLKILHSGSSLESTHSLTYLEWVHERQTRRMRTRSEWFLSPVIPTKSNGSLKSNPFECISTGLLRPHSPFDGPATMGSCEGQSGSPDIGDGYHLSSERGPVAEVVVQTSTVATSRTVGGVVRQRSWRTHYVRPNRAHESDVRTRGFVEGVVTSSSRSTPVYRRNIPHAYSRSLPGSGRNPVISFSNEQQQQPIISGNWHPSDVRGTSHHEGPKMIQQSKNVHF